MEEDVIVQQAQVTNPVTPKQDAGDIVGRLQNEISTKSFDPTKYSNQQLSVVSELLKQGVLKGPPLENIVQTFQTTRERLAKEKAFNIDPIAVATEGKSIMQGDLLGLVPTRPGAEFIGDFTGSMIPFIRNKDLLLNSLAMPAKSQSSLFTQKALELANYIEKTPGLGKRLTFTKGVLGTVGAAADSIISGRLKPLAITQAQSLAGGALGAGAGTVAYDFVNRSVGKDLAVAIQSDLANIPDQEVSRDTTLATVEAMKNSLMWGAAGTALMPILGMAGTGLKSLFGLKGDKALELAQYANEKGLPIPLLAGMDKGPFAYFGKTYFKTIGVFPFVSKIGDVALREAEEKVGKAFLSDMHSFAPIMKSSALSVASLDQFKKNFEKHANLIAANYTALMNKVDDVGNPAIIKLTKTNEAAASFVNEYKESIPALRGLGGEYSVDKKALYSLTQQEDPLFQLMDAIQSTSIKPYTFKEYAGLQKMLTKAIQKTQFFDVRKSLFSLREGLENDLAESFATLNAKTLLQDPSIKTVYEATLASSGKQGADAYLDNVLKNANELNMGLKEANTIFSKTLAFYDKSVARQLKIYDKTLFTNKQLNGITGAEAVSPTKLFNTIETNVFKSGDADAVEQLKVLYGYNTSKEGKEMFNRAFNKYMYNSFIEAFDRKTYAPGGVLDIIDKVVTKSPKSTVATDVIQKLGQDELAAARGFTVKDALDGKGKEVIDIKFGKDDFAEFSADKFLQNLGQYGNPKTSAEARRAISLAYGGGKQGEEGLKNLERFINYTKALQDIPISETSSFLQRRLTLGGSAAILGGAAAMAGSGGILQSLIFLYFSRQIGKVLSDPTALRYMMDALQPAERAALAKEMVGVKTVAGVPITYGETKAKQFARFANYLADEDQDLPKIDPKNINPEDVIRRLQDLPTRVPKQGLTYSSLPQQERERMFPEIEVRRYASPTYNIESDAFRGSYVQGNTQALTALNTDHGIQKPAATAVGQEIQGKQQLGNALQTPSAQPLQTPGTQPTGQKYAGLFPFDVLGQQIANRQG